MPNNNLMSKFVKTYFDKTLDLNIQSFNLLGFAGMAASVAGAVISVVTDAGAANIAACSIAFLLAFVLLRVAGKKLSYRICCWIVVVAVFMLAFPIMFFASGGYRSGMPCFFLFAIIYTTIMLEKHERNVALAIEFVIYVGCCFAAYYAPGTVYSHPEFFYLGDVVLGIVASGILLMLVVLLHIRMYRVRQIQIRELNRELEARNETLIKYDKMKSDFLAAVAHEISKPLTAISASSADTMELIKESPVNMDEVAENHRRIEKKVMLIDGIVTDLMDTVAIENGRLPLSRQRLELSEFLRSICGGVFTHLNANGNRIAYDLQQDLPHIWADPLRLEQVMTNLISNADRHTKNGVITVKLSRSEKGQTVCVTDNGEGMEREMADVVLKQYISSGGDYWRHGYGLYVCRQIVLSHGGEIWIDSEKGRGTSVSFTLAEAGHE